MQSPILGQSYNLRTPNAADNRMVNIYPEIIVEGGKQAAYLTRAPGLRRLATLGDGPVRGLWQTGDYGYAVSGNTFYKITSSWAANAIGSVAGFGPVSMADNGLQIFIAANPYGYIYDIAANTMTQILDPDFPGAVTVGFLDGYFVFNEPNSQRVWITALYDGTQIDALDFASAEGSPDQLVAVAIDHREAWLFGTNSVEVWYDSGASDFPLQRIQGAYNEIGCVAAYSVAKLDNGLFWLGADARGRGIVYRANGYTGQRISTHAVEWAIQQYSNINDAIGYTYQQDGHAFYVLIFPTARTTWVYDVATQAWHERAGWENGEFVRHRSNCQMSFANEVVVGDYNSGKIYAFDKNVYTDDGDIQKWLRSWRALPTGQNDLRRTAQHSLQIDLSTGTKTVATEPTPAPNPGPPLPPASVYPWIMVYDPNYTTQASGSIAFNSASDVIFLASGSAIAGTPPAYHLVRATYYPVIQFKKEINNTNANSDAKLLAVDSSDNIYIGGYGDYTYQVGSTDTLPAAYIAKLNSNGDVLWQKYELIAQPGGTTQYSSYAHSVQVDAADNIIVCGAHKNFNGTGNNVWNHFITKLSPTGAILWSKTFENSGALYATCYTKGSNVDADGNFYALFFDYHSDTDSVAKIVKFDANGNVIWAKQISDSAPNVQTIVCATDGTSYAIIKTSAASVLMAHAADGTLIWQKYFSGYAFEDVSLDINGNIFVLASTSNITQLVAKITPLGAVEWQQAIDCTNTNAHAITVNKQTDQVYLTSAVFADGVVNTFVSILRRDDPVTTTITLSSFTFDLTVTTLSLSDGAIATAPTTVPAGTLNFSLVDANNAYSDTESYLWYYWYI